MFAILHAIHFHHAVKRKMRPKSMPAARRKNRRYGCNPKNTQNTPYCADRVRRVAMQITFSLHRTTAHACLSLSAIFAILTRDFESGLFQCDTQVYPKTDASSAMGDGRDGLSTHHKRKENEKKGREHAECSADLNPARPPHPSTRCCTRLIKNFKNAQILQNT
jgi:hypothetical protein